jgi:hypothetical protein
VLPINSSLLTITLYPSVRTTPIYNDTKYSAPSTTLQPSSTAHCMKILRIRQRLVFGAPFLGSLLLDRCPSDRQTDIYCTKLCKPFYPIQCSARREETESLFQCHTANTRTAVLQVFFGDHTVRRALRPPRSPDLPPPNFAMWRFLKASLQQ